MPDVSGRSSYTAYRLVIASAAIKMKEGWYLRVHRMEGFPAACGFGFGLGGWDVVVGTWVLWPGSGIFPKYQKKNSHLRESRRFRVRFREIE